MNDPHRSPGTMPLSLLLREAAQDLRHVQPPAALRERLAAHCAASASPRRHRWRAPLGWSGAAACGLALLTSLLLLTLPAAPVQQTMAAEPSASGFVPLVGPERWRQLTADAATPAWLVDTELPRERLAAIGLPFDPARAAEPVRAELLMHASGDVIALRLLGE
ncbi:MAG TPA: hypothetical protein VFO28_14430 [Burkholderiaceae bacterium]|nr:hypothetical protein [Burkholderiaceae bacterium]